MVEGGGGFLEFEGRDGLLVVAVRGGLTTVVDLGVFVIFGGRRDGFAEFFGDGMVFSIPLELVEGESEGLETGDAAGGVSEIAVSFDSAVASILVYKSEPIVSFDK